MAKSYLNSKDFSLPQFDEWENKSEFAEVCCARTICKLSMILLYSNNQERKSKV